MPFSLLSLELFASLESLPEVAAGLSEAVRRRAAPAKRLAGDVTVYSGAEAMREATPAWTAIERDGGVATPFQTLALAEASSAAHLAHGHTPHVIVVREGAHPVAVLPLVVTRLAGFRAVRFLGDPLIQYGDVIAGSCASDAHIASALHAAREISADVALFRKVRADARIAPLLAARARAFSEDKAPYVDLRRAPASCPRDTREQRRFRRKLLERGEIGMSVVRGTDSLPLIRKALDLKRQWLQSRGLSSAVIGDPAWENALLALAARNGSPLVCVRLDAGGTLAAIEIALLHGKHWHAFLGATAPEFAKAGPGHVQMIETIEHCRGQGLAAYDLLAPADRFKVAIATHQMPVRDYALPLNLGGHVLAYAARIAPRTKKLFATMPPALRRLAAAPLRTLR